MMCDHDNIMVIL